MFYRLVQAKNLKILQTLMLVLRGQFFDLYRETLYEHALRHLEAAGPEKANMYFSSYSKCLSTFDLFEGL